MSWKLSHDQTLVEVTLLSPNDVGVFEQELTLI